MVWNYVTELIWPLGFISKYLADGGGDEAMVNIVVAGLKSVVIITSSSLSWLLLGVA